MKNVRHVPKNGMLRRKFIKGCAACVMMASCSPPKDDESFASTPTAPNGSPNDVPNDEPNDSAASPSDTGDTNPSGPDNAYEIDLGQHNGLMQVGGVEFFNADGIVFGVTRIGSGAEDFSVVSGFCTHQGCVIMEDALAAGNPDQGAQWYHCPCHEARFDALGNVLNGPAEDPLPKFEFSVSGNSLFVIVV